MNINLSITFRNLGAEQDNQELLSQVVNNTKQILEVLNKFMANTNDTLGRIEKDESELSSTLSQVATYVKASVDQIAELKAEIAAKTAAGEDTTRLESIATNLESSISSAKSILPQASADSNQAAPATAAADASSSADATAATPSDPTSGNS